MPETCFISSIFLNFPFLLRYSIIAVATESPTPGNFFNYSIFAELILIFELCSFSLLKVTLS